MLVVDMEKHEFIPSTEKDATNPVTFYVIPPTRKTMLKVQDLLQATYTTEEEFKASFKFSEYANLLLEDCLVGWKNIQKSDGTELKFSKDNINYISDLIILTELTNFIDGLGKPSK